MRLALGMRVAVDMGVAVDMRVALDEFENRLYDSLGLHVPSIIMLTDVYV